MKCKHNHHCVRPTGRLISPWLHTSINRRRFHVIKSQYRCVRCGATWYRFFTTLEKWNARGKKRAEQMLPAIPVN